MPLVVPVRRTNTPPTSRERHHPASTRFCYTLKLAETNLHREICSDRYLRINWIFVTASPDRTYLIPRSATAARVDVGVKSAAAPVGWDHPACTSDPAHSNGPAVQSGSARRRGAARENSIARAMNLPIASAVRSFGVVLIPIVGSPMELRRRRRPTVSGGSRATRQVPCSRAPQPSERWSWRLKQRTNLGRATFSR